MDPRKNNSGPSRRRERANGPEMIYVSDDEDDEQDQELISAERPSRYRETPMEQRLNGRGVPMRQYQMPTGHDLRKEKPLPELPIGEAIIQNPISQHPLSIGFMPAPRAIRQELISQHPLPTNCVLSAANHKQRSAQNVEKRLGTTPPTSRSSCSSQDTSQAASSTHVSSLTSHTQSRPQNLSRPFGLAGRPSSPTLGHSRSNANLLRPSPSRQLSPYDPQSRQRPRSFQAEFVDPESFRPVHPPSYPKQEQVSTPHRPQNNLTNPSQFIGHRAYTNDSDEFARRAADKAAEIRRRMEAFQLETSVAGLNSTFDDDDDDSDKRRRGSSGSIGRRLSGAIRRLSGEKGESGAEAKSGGLKRMWSGKNSLDRKSSSGSARRPAPTGRRRINDIV